MITFIRGGGDIFSAFEAFEGILAGEQTITFAKQSRKVIVTNDSPSEDLLFKFTSAGEFGTLKPTETMDLMFQTTQVFLSANGANFRVWGYR